MQPPAKAGCLDIRVANGKIRRLWGERKYSITSSTPSLDEATICKPECQGRRLLCCYSVMPFASRGCQLSCDTCLITNILVVLDLYFNHKIALK